MKKSVLDEIEGVGPGRRKKLMSHFGSIKAMREADVEELAVVVPRNVAENIKRKLGEKANEDNQRQPEGPEAGTAPGHDDPPDNR